MELGLHCEIGRKLVDSEWDKFIETTPGGYHMQSSLWSVFKADFDWSPIRLVLKSDSRIIGGVQVLVRRLPFGYKIANVLQGPILPNCGSGLFDILIDSLMKIIETERISYLVLQPGCRWDSVDEFTRWGFQESSILGGERATVWVDLCRPTDTMFRQLRRTTRTNIRRAECQGVSIRDGAKDDIHLFYELLKATAGRKRFRPVSESYYENMWDHLRPSRHIHLFIAEYNAEVISGLLAVTFADTAMAKGLAWSGRNRWLRPNDLLVWNALTWSKENGYSRFDLSGINVSVARALLHGKPLSNEPNSGLTRFKLGFGGSVVILPPTYEYISNPVLRSLIHNVPLKLGVRNLTTMLHRILTADKLKPRDILSGMLSTIRLKVGRRNAIKG